jgi:hypothetical protein
MTYRRKSENQIAWNKWLSKNVKTLKDCGVPDIVVESESRWWDFLLHGYLDHHDDISKFSEENLSETEMLNLFNFLKSELSNKEKESSIVFARLRTRFINRCND